MWNQNLRWKRSQSKRLKHNRPNVSLCNRAAWAQPFAGSQPLLCLITPHPVTKQQGLPCNWTVHPWTLPISNELSVRNLLVLLLLSYWWAPHWAISDDNGQWGTTGEVIQSRVNGAMVIGLLPLGILLFFFFFNRECISGRWGKLNFPTQYESWSVPNNISGGDIYDFLGSDV